MMSENAPLNNDIRDMQTASAPRCLTVPFQQYCYLAALDKCIPLMIMKLQAGQTSILCCLPPVVARAVDHLVARQRCGLAAAVLVVALPHQPALEAVPAQVEAQVHGADLLLAVARAAAHSLRLHTAVEAALAAVRSPRLHEAAAAALAAAHAQELY